jgi:hypothetical protein
MSSFSPPPCKTSRRWRSDCSSPHSPLRSHPRLSPLLDQRPQVHHLVGHRWFLGQVWCSQPDPTGESSVTTAKPLARYSAIWGRASDRLCHRRATPSSGTRPLLASRGREYTRRLLLPRASMREVWATLKKSRRSRAGRYGQKSIRSISPSRMHAREPAALLSRSGAKFLWRRPRFLCHQFS